MSSTPMSTTSSSDGYSEHSSYCSQIQSEPINDTACGIANHVWQFPSLEVAHMLSPKGPKPWLKAAGQLLPLDHHDCIVDELAFQIALDEVVIRLANDEILTSQSLEHHDLAGFLTRCMEVCHDALDKQPNAPLRQDRRNKDLRFTVKTPTADCSTSPQQPIMGGRFPAGGDEMLHPDPLEGEPTNAPTLPVEVGTSWKQIASRAPEDSCWHRGERQETQGSFSLVPTLRMRFPRTNWGRAACWQRWMVDFHGRLASVAG